MKLDPSIAKAISHVQDAESDLAKDLRATSERHATEHDLYHLGHTLARQCEDHLAGLAACAERYGTAPRTVASPPGLVERLRHKGAELAGRSEASGPLLLRDLRALYIAAQKTEIAWVILTQAALAVRDHELLQVTSTCHQETETCAKWLRTRIKETAPQVLAAG